jgi:hypothetical protein
MKDNTKDIQVLFEAMERLNPAFKRNLLKEEALINEVEVDDFFNFIERDPRLNTFSYVYYASTLDRFLAKRTSNPFVGRFIKLSRYKFMFGQTYVRATEIKNPEWIVQQRSGEYQKVQGYNVLETDKGGNLGLPIVPLETKSKILFVGDGGKVHEIEKNQLLTWARESGYEQFFIPSFWAEKDPEAPPTGSGIPYRALKLDSIYRIAAGGAEWRNPHFKYAQFAQYFDI